MNIHWLRTYDLANHLLFFSLCHYCNQLFASWFTCTVATSKSIHSVSFDVDCSLLLGLEWTGSFWSETIWRCGVHPLLIVTGMDVFAHRKPPKKKQSKKSTSRCALYSYHHTSYIKLFFKLIRKHDIWYFVATSWLKWQIMMAYPPGN